MEGPYLRLIVDAVSAEGTRTFDLHPLFDSFPVEYVFARQYFGLLIYFISADGAYEL
jgi:hypothetical protein